jgi:hypothetical protein
LLGLAKGIVGRVARRIYLLSSSVDVVFKDAFLNRAVRKSHPTMSVLNALDPLALIEGAVDPLHLAISVSFVVQIATFIPVAGSPLEDAVTVFLVELIISVIEVSVVVLALPPLSPSMLQPVLERPNVGRPVAPLILTVTIWLPLNIAAGVNVFVSKNVCALTVLQAVEPLPFIPVTVLPLVHSIAFCLRLIPLPDVRVSKESSPNSVTLL